MPNSLPSHPFRPRKSHFCPFCTPPTLSRLHYADSSHMPTLATHRPHSSPGGRPSTPQTRPHTHLQQAQGQLRTETLVEAGGRDSPHRVQRGGMPPYSKSVPQKGAHITQPGSQERRVQQSHIHAQAKNREVRHLPCRSSTHRRTQEPIRYVQYLLFPLLACCTLSAQPFYSFDPP